MTQEITLFDGCWVKTRFGHVLGPMKDTDHGWISPYADYDHSFWGDGTSFHHSEDNVTAVYPSLAAAAAANPEM